jgi:hypothetical protein
MNRVFKLAALILAVAVLAAPAAALSRCWISSDAAQHGCLAGCPMMTQMPQPTIVVKAAANGTSCCNLSAGLPVPPVQMQGPNVTPVAANPLHTAFSPVVAVAPVRSGLQDAVPLKSALLVPQAVLCTFLI